MRYTEYLQKREFFLLLGSILCSAIQVWIWNMYRWLQSWILSYSEHKYLAVFTGCILGDTRGGGSRCWKQVTQRPTVKLNDCSRQWAAYNGGGRRVQIHRRSNHPKLYFHQNQPLLNSEAQCNAMQYDIPLSGPSHPNLMRTMYIQLCSVIPLAK